MNYIDLHCDTLMELYQKKDKNLYDNDLQISVKHLIKGECLLQCFAMFVPFKVENPFETCMEMIDKYYLEIEKNSEYIKPVFSIYF